MAQARAETLVLTMDSLSFQQQGQPVGVAEACGLVIVGKVGEGLGHALQAKAVQLIERRVALSRGRRGHAGSTAVS